MQMMYEFPYIFTKNTQYSGGFLLPPAEWNGMLSPDTSMKQVLLDKNKVDMFILPELMIIPLATDFKFSFCFDKGQNQEDIILSRSINGVKLKTPHVDCSNLQGRYKSQMNIVGVLLNDNKFLTCRLIGSAMKQSQILQNIMRNLFFNLLNRGEDTRQPAILRLYVDENPEVVSSMTGTESAQIFPIRAKPFNPDTDILKDDNQERIGNIKQYIENFYQEMLLNTSQSEEHPECLQHQAKPC